MTTRKDVSLWTPPRPRLVVLVYLLIVGFNAFDAFATLAALDKGADELNPLMRAALELGPAAFIAVKMALIGFLCALLALVTMWRTRQVRERKFAWTSLRLLTAVYGLVFVWHIGIVVYASSLSA